MLDLDHNAPCGKRLIFHQLSHIEDWAAGNVDLVEEFHGFVLGVLLRPFLDNFETLIKVWKAGLRRCVIWMADKLCTSDELHQRLPDLGLDDHIDVVVGTAGLTFERSAWMATTGCVAGTRHRLAKGLVRVLRIFLQGAVGKPLLVA